MNSLLVNGDRSSVVNPKSSIHKETRRHREISVSLCLFVKINAFIRGLSA